MLASSEDLAPFSLTRTFSSVSSDIDLTVDPSVSTTRFPYAVRIFTAAGATLVLHMAGDGGTTTTITLGANTFREGKFTKIVASGSSIVSGVLEVSWR